MARDRILSSPSRPRKTFLDEAILGKHPPAAPREQKNISRKQFCVFWGRGEGPNPFFTIPPSDAVWAPRGQEASRDLFWDLLRPHLGISGGLFWALFFLLSSLFSLLSLVSLSSPCPLLVAACACARPSALCCAWAPAGALPSETVPDRWSFCCSPPPSSLSLSRLCYRARACRADTLPCVCGTCLGPLSLVCAVRLKKKHRSHDRCCTRPLCFPPFASFRLLSPPPPRAHAACHVRMHASLSRDAAQNHRPSARAARERARPFSFCCCCCAPPPPLCAAGATLRQGIAFDCRRASPCLGCSALALRRLHPSLRHCAIRAPLAIPHGLRLAARPRRARCWSSYACRSRPRAAVSRRPPLTPAKKKKKKAAPRPVWHSTLLNTHPFHLPPRPQPAAVRTMALLAARRRLPLEGLARIRPGACQRRGLVSAAARPARGNDTAPPPALNFYDTTAHEVAAQVWHALSCQPTARLFSPVAGSSESVRGHCASHAAALCVPSACRGSPWPTCSPAPTWTPLYVVRRRARRGPIFAMFNVPALRCCGHSSSSRICAPLPQHHAQIVQEQLTLRIAKRLDDFVSVRRPGPCPCRASPCGLLPSAHAAQSTWRCAHGAPFLLFLSFF